MTWQAKLYLRAARLLYSRFAWAYDLVTWVISLGRVGHWRRLVLEHVVGRRILEIGFGTGELLIEMTRRGLEAYGLELSPAMHRVVAEKMYKRGLSAPRVLANAQKMPFADGSFDTIVATFPTEYVLLPSTLQEVTRLLSQDGRFVIVGLSVEIENAILRLATQSIFSDSTKSEASLCKQLAAAGFKVTVNPHKEKWLKLSVLILERGTET